MNPTARPWTLSTAAPFALRRDGAPSLLVGGQVFNSASSSPKAIADSFAHVRRVGSNVVLSPVSWALSEPAEGAFDFALVDIMLAEARANGLRLVLLWFGAFKNAASTYAPTWVRGNPGRFPRVVVEPKGMQAFTYEGATAKPVLSVFSPELREADAKAFEALIRHLVDADPDGTVVMVQVENESGLLSDSRDRNHLAEAVWSA
ncbi:MAG: beta-galactosidase, partial [Microbacterium sp.]